MNQIRITRGPSARAEALEPRRLMAGPPSWGLAVHAMAFEDLDGNGRRTRNEPALPNVAIYNTTYGGESYAGATDDDGRWSYYSTGGAPADVRAVPPEGLHFSAGEDGTRSAFYPGRGGRTMVRRLRPIALTRTAGISGMLFFDRDGDGVREPDAAGLRGWRVFLHLNRHDLRQRREPSATTDADGDWHFGGVRPGPYRAVVIRRRRYELTTQPAFDFDIAEGRVVDGVQFGARPSSAPAAAPANTAAIAHPPGPDPEASAPPRSANVLGPYAPGTVYGSVFQDVDGDGRRDHGDAPLAGVEVVLTGFFGNATRTNTRDDGSFEAVAPQNGEFTLSVVPPDGWHPPAGDLGSRTFYMRFGDGYFIRNKRLKPIPLTQTGGIEGTVFLDTNADGLRDGDSSGVPRRRVYLDGNNDGFRQKSEPRTRSDASGNWYFRGLAAGTYRVDVDPGPRYTPTTGHGAREVTVPSGTVVKDVLFGLWPTGTGAIFN